MFKSLIRVLLAATLVLVSLPIATAQEDADFKEDLALLAKSMARLADTLERQERAREQNGGIERLRVLVSLLNIRAQKNEALQKELRQWEDQEQRTMESMGTLRSRLERAEELLNDPEVMNTEGLEEDLERQQSELKIRMGSLETRLNYTSQRQVELQNRIGEQERLVDELDGLVESSRQLIANKHRWLVAHRHGNHGALTHIAGQLDGLHLHRMFRVRKANVSQHGLG